MKKRISLFLSLAMAVTLVSPEQTLAASQNLVSSVEILGENVTADAEKETVTGEAVKEGETAEETTVQQPAEEPKSDTAKETGQQDPSEEEVQPAEKENKTKNKKETDNRSAVQETEQTAEPEASVINDQPSQPQEQAASPVGEENQNAAEIDIDNQLMEQNTVSAEQTQPQETVLTEDTVLEQTDSQIRSVSGQAFYRLPTKPDELFLKNGLPNANNGYFAPCFYYQYDEEFRNWVAADGTQDAASSGAFSHRGCGPTTMANVISVLTGNRITPTDVATAAELSPSRAYTYAGGDGGYKIVTWACENYGLTCQGLGADMNAVKQYLKEGYLVVVVGAGTLCASGLTTGSAHYGYCYSYNEANDSTIFVGQANLMSPASGRYRNQQYVSMAELSEALNARAGIPGGGPAWAITGYASDYKGRTAEQLGAYTGCFFQSMNKMNATAQVCYGCWKVAEEDGTILVPALTRTGDGFSYSLSEDGSWAAITGYSGLKRKIEIPAQINEIPVKVVSEGAFANQANITDVMVSEGIEVIAREAFASCSSLRSVELPSTLKKMGAEVFARSYEIKNVGYFSAGVKLNKNVFLSCGKDLVVYCYPDSKAEALAKKWGLPYSYAISPMEEVHGLTSVTWENGRAFVEWEENIYADGYEVMYFEEQENAGSNAIFYAATNDPRMVVERLERGKTYYLMVRAYTLSGEKKVYGKYCLPVCIKAQ